VSWARCEASADLFPLSPSLPPRSFAAAGYAAAELRGAATYLQQPLGKPRHISGELQQESSLCDLPRTATSLVRHHEASRGPMAILESLLTSCVPDGCGVSTRAFVQTRPSARKIIPASITSPLLRPSAPRQHVLTSTIHAPPQPTASESTPHSALLNRSLARAGCNPEFCRPRTPSPKVHSLLLVTEVLLSSPLKPSQALQNSYLQIAGRITE
jgi:hypothetical protein